MNFMRSVAIITGPDTHLDHLGVLSSVLQIPLLVVEQKTFDTAKVYYPDINVSLIDFADLSFAYLAQHFDVIFETGKFWAAELSPFFELLFRKKMRFVFCPHGNSDKGHSLQHHVEQDLSLVYGEHLKALLTGTGAAAKIKHFARTGNYRYPYYLRHRTFYDALAHEKVFSRFRSEKPTLLYAPTWHDKENPTSFFAATDSLVKQLSSSFNLVIKLHPFLLEDFPGQSYPLMGRYENHDSVLFVTDFPAIYPLLAKCDLYLGDYSSIGYDFLAFNKPLFFLNPKKNSNPSPLYSCGLEVPQNHENLKDFLLKNWKKSDFTEQRQKIYNYAFGNELTFEGLRNNIFTTIANTG